MFAVIGRMQERFRVGTLLDMYASRGASFACQYFSYLEASHKLPQTPVYRVMAKLVELECLLDKHRFDEASNAARTLIDHELPMIETRDDCEYLHLLIEFCFHMRRIYPEWLMSQARPHNYNPDELDFFLRKKISIQTEPAADPDDGSEIPPPDADNP